MQRPWFTYFVLVGVVALVGSLVTSTPTGGAGALLIYLAFLWLVHRSGL